MESCIFCKIIKKEADASIIFQNELVTAFLDINPINNGHVLIVPNQHSRNFTNVDDKHLAEMFKVSRDILSSIEKSDINCEGANIFLSDGEVAGQEVMHSHLHIAPRFMGDGHKMGFSDTMPRDYPKREELNKTAEEIRKNL